jgi:hypothetical protein
MNIKQLRRLILSFKQDVVFEYQGQIACISAWSVNKFEVNYDNKERVYDSIDYVFDDKFYHGKSLYEIADKIILQ